MRYARFHDEVISLHNDRISEQDARRQQEAATELLRRFDRQPGVVLADEVGMGKTFVALAAAISVLLDRPDQGPVVVMCPSSLREKWPRDWEVFKEKCLGQAHRSRFRAASANGGLEFLKLLDDPVERKNHIIFLTHGALHQGINDPYARLGLIKRAFKGRSSLGEKRKVFPRFAARLLRQQHVERLAPGLFGDLLERPYDAWLRTIHGAHPDLQEKVKDDPVPAGLIAALDELPSSDLEDVVAALRGLPLRESANVEQRLSDARRAIGRALDALWRKALQQTDFSSPLLILDEAHHVKNPGTRLASLFASEDSVKDSTFFDKAGPLGGKFDRMIFLTATPFQLGHGELIRVLERFEGINWSGTLAPEITRPEFIATLRTLGDRLDDAQAAAIRLNTTWGRLDPDDLLDDTGASLEPDDWWELAKTRTGEGVIPSIVAQVERTRVAMAAAEELLSPWVLRYVKHRFLPTAPEVDRRALLPGAAILDDGSPLGGLDISGSVLLPFLLAGRAQGLLATSTRGRAFFAEGLASSFEAYQDTRSRHDTTEEDPDAASDTALPPELHWYLKHLDDALPRQRADVRAAHPKVRATAERAVDLWKKGEKVLVFCHYRATGRALRQHISALLQAEIMQMARNKASSASDADVAQTLASLGDRFDADRRLGRISRDWIRTIVAQYPDLAKVEETVVDAVQRFIRTPSFLVRYLPLAAEDIEAEFLAAVEGTRVGTQPLKAQVEHFCQFLAERCIDAERTAVLEALDKVQTGSHIGRDVQAAFDPMESSGSGTDAVLLPNVRLANGEVRQDTRQRLLRTFNTPLFPEILIASSVMAEGVDLHLNCRYVIHHDLCWNPSTLEQRSGRVDRIGCKAERDRQSIHLYMPYVAATQDEKMYRVVRDRERWFQVIMGEKYSVDEATTDKQAARILLPSQVAQTLTMKLHP